MASQALSPLVPSSLPGLGSGPPTPNTHLEFQPEGSTCVSPLLPGPFA